MTRANLLLTDYDAVGPLLVEDLVKVAAPLSALLTQELDGASAALGVSADEILLAEKWDKIITDGDIAAKDCLLKYSSGGRVLAVASIYRDLDSLKAELAMEQGTMS